MNASTKRIIWALGWFMCWEISEYIYYLKHNNPSSIEASLVMMAIWIIPLFLFRDDK